VIPEEVRIASIRFGWSSYQGRMGDVLALGAQTTVLNGEFHNADVKKEFFDNVKLQQEFAPR
jgi:hypothetical protein